MSEKERVYRIGYQGIEGSNAQYAAQALFRKLCALQQGRACGTQEEESGELRCVYLPLISSMNVVAAISSGDADFGVLAVRNTIGEMVTETQDALELEPFGKLLSVRMPIHHDLFVLPGTEPGQLSRIVSHPQALRQTARTRARLYPQLAEEPWEDTAKAAEDLAAGILSPDCGVLCRREAGERFGLTLLRERLEDRADNLTEFWLIRGI